MRMIPGVLGQSLAIVLATACRTTVHEQPAATDVEPRELSVLDSTWFRRVLDSDRFRHYLTIPAGSVQLARIPRGTLSRMAMVESFIGYPSWERIRCVATLQPDEFSGLAVLNYLAIRNPINFVSFDLEKIDQVEESRGLEAAVFAHIEDQRSHRSLLNPFNWIGDRAGYHRNAHWTCAEWLAERTRSYMVQEWERLSRFTRNTAIRHLASRCVERTNSRDGSEEFSRIVEEIRALHREFLGHELLDTSVHEVMGDRREVREFEIRFFGKHEAVAHYVFLMTGIRPMYVNHDVRGIIRVPRWPHVVSMEGGSRYLDEIAELFTLLENDEPGEIDLEHSKFLVVRGDYSMLMDEALPPYTRLGIVPGKRLLVARVLNENLEQVRRALTGEALPSASETLERVIRTYDVDGTIVDSDNLDSAGRRFLAWAFRHLGEIDEETLAILLGLPRE